MDNGKCLVKHEISTPNIFVDFRLSSKVPPHVTDNALDMCEDRFVAATAIQLQESFDLKGMSDFTTRRI